MKKDRNEGERLAVLDEFVFSGRDSLFILGQAEEDLQGPFYSERYRRLKNLAPLHYTVFGKTDSVVVIREWRVGEIKMP